MYIFEVELEVRFKEFGKKRPVMKDLILWVSVPLGFKNVSYADLAIKKAKKYAMKKQGYDMGYPLSVKLMSVVKRGYVHVQ